MAARATFGSNTCPPPVGLYLGKSWYGLTFLQQLGLFRYIRWTDRGAR